MANPPIVLLTDFGTADPFAGILKGVIARIAPEIATIDLTHEIPAGDIRRAAIILWQSAHFFPAGAIFLAVVDPGVGTSRRPLIIQPQKGQAGGFTWIGPDNGLFTFVTGEHSIARELANPAYRLANPSATFHGRDIFAPAAAYAALGVGAEEFGPPVPDPLRLPSPRLELRGDNQGPGEKLSGEILFADRFGNLLTSLGVFERQSGETIWLKPWIGRAGIRRMAIHQARLILPGGRRLPWVDTFGQIPRGEAAVLAGSSGLLEIASNRESAAELLKLGEGVEITLSFRPLP